MSSQYSQKWFLRKPSSASLEAYFQQKHLLPDFDFSNLKGHKRINALHHEINELPEQDRQTVQQDFQDIHWLSHKEGGGWKTIIQEAAYKGIEIPGAFSAQAGLHDKVMQVFLQHQDIFRTCLQLAKRQIYSQISWRQIDIPNASFMYSEDRLNVLSQRLIDHYTQHHGKGTACEIEPFDRDNLHYFFARLDDYARTEEEFVNQKEFRPVLRCPSFEVILVFDTNTNRLDVFTMQDRQTAQAIQSFFAGVMLDVSLPEVRRDKKIYELNPLRNRSFEFQYQPESGIAGVRVNRLRLTSPDAAGKIFIENEDGTPKGIYDMMDATLNKARIYPWKVTQANLSVFFHEPDGRQQSVITFNVSYPSTCTIGQEGRYGIIRQMLKDSGIDVTHHEQQQRIPA